MKNGFARYYTPLCFFGRWRPFNGRHRSRSLFDDLRRISYRPDSYHTAPFGSVKIERRRMLDDDVSLGRERKLEGYLICFFGLSTYRWSMVDQGVKSICHTQ